MTKLHILVEGFPFQPHLVYADLLISANIGGLFGLFTGRFHADALRSQVQLSAQRDAFAFLNKFLRHNILNSANVIDGYAAELESSVSDEDDSESVSIIRDRGEALADVIHQSSRFSDTFVGKPDTHPVNLSTMVVKEIACLNPMTHRLPEPHDARSEPKVDSGGGEREEDHQVPDRM